MFILRLLLCDCKSACLNMFIPFCSASLSEMHFYHWCWYCVLEMQIWILLHWVVALIFSENDTLHFDTEFFPSYTLKGEKSIKIGDKSQPSDGPRQREHSIRRAFHNDKGKQIFSSRWVLYPLGLCNLKKVNYFFLVLLGIQEEAVYFIISKHTAAMKMVISLAATRRVIGSQLIWSLHKSPKPKLWCFRT